MFHQLRSRVDCRYHIPKMFSDISTLAASRGAIPSNGKAPEISLSFFLFDGLWNNRSPFSCLILPSTGSILSLGTKFVGLAELAVIYSCKNPPVAPKCYLPSASRGAIPLNGKAPEVLLLFYLSNGLWNNRSPFSCV